MYFLSVFKNKLFRSCKITVAAQNHQFFQTLTADISLNTWPRTLIFVGTRLFLGRFLRGKVCLNRYEFFYALMSTWVTFRHEVTCADAKNRKRMSFHEFSKPFNTHFLTVLNDFLGIGACIWMWPLHWNPRFDSRHHGSHGLGCITSILSYFT